MRKYLVAATIAATFVVPATASAAYLRMAQVERIAQQEAEDFADIGEDSGVNSCDRYSAHRIDCEIYSYDDLDDMECTATVTFVARGNKVYWSHWRGIDCESNRL